MQENPAHVHSHHPSNVHSKTGMPIAPNGRIARTSNGMEDMDAFFAGSPASIPPLQRAKRISQTLEEQEEYVEEDDDNEEDLGQTASYAGQGRISNATSRALTSDEEEEQYEHQRGDTSRDQEQEYEEEEYSRNNITGVSSVHRGRRQSGRSDMYAGEISVVEEDEYDVYAEDDGGTKTMSLEGSKHILSIEPSHHKLSLNCVVYCRLFLQQEQPYYR